MERWRLLKDPPMEGASNMARDEAILRNFVVGDSLPTLRLYSWSSPTISIGYAQKADRFLALERALPVVRRLTGGRAVLHDMELTYSIVAPTSNSRFNGGIDAAYRLIGGAIVDALKVLGVNAEIVRPSSEARSRGKKRDEACFNSHSRYEITLEGRKLSGSAQRRFGDLFLQHGSILMGLDVELTEMVFGPDSAGKAAWTDQSLDLSGEVTPERLGAALVTSMAGAFDAVFLPGQLTERELESARLFIQEKKILLSRG